MIAREKPPIIEPDPTAGQAPDGAPAEEGDADKGPSPFDPLLRHLSELQMLALHYLRARAGSNYGSRLRVVLFWAIAGLVGLIIAIAFLVTAVVLVLRGIAVGLILLGLQPWAADLITGVVCIAVVGLTLVFVSMSQKSSARRKRRDDYEHFRARYRAKFGHSLDETGRDGG